MKRRRLVLLATVLLCAITAWAWQARVRAQKAPPTLAAMLPQGALLTIESPDFATLLADWNKSPEAHAWLGSDNYNVFSNSRLFGRLADAQAEFFSAAFAQGNTPDAPTLLAQVAGKQSIFAWYNVGNLEFLYITRMPSAQSLQSALLQQRARFQHREAGGHAFYIRTSKESPARTVAFATLPDPAGKGDLLLLSTREDLLAGALTLLAGDPTAQPLTAEPWYAEADAALPRNEQPALHMVLNLERIVQMPYFRSYWVQQNITEMAQYRAAAADLYRTPAEFREERALLPKTAPDPTPGASLAALAALAPQDGVFRATATDDPATAITALEEKLLGRQHPPAQIQEQAPDADLTPTQQGTATDLETRIDTPAPVSATYSNEALAAALKSARFDALLTYSAAAQPAPNAPLWVPVHNAVVLHAASDWNPKQLQSAVQQALRGTLTTGTLGIEFRATGGDILGLTGPKPLYLAVRGPVAFLSDDQPLLVALLRQPTQAPEPSPATIIAGFSHTAQRAPYARLTALIDSTDNTPSDTPAGTPKAPAYFSQNLRSLSDSFARLQSERFTQFPQAGTIHQTVLYQWQ